MIFNTNSTSLGNYSTPMAEGYNGACGADLALVLIENARNDYAMFEAMLNVDAQELAIKKNESGYVAEGAIRSLQESSSGGILSKLKELIKKFIAKIKAIFHNFVARISSLFVKDKDFIKKYKSELLYKSVDNLEVKWRKLKESYKDLLKAYDEGNTLTPDESEITKYINETDKEKMYGEILNGTSKITISNPKSITNDTEYKEELMDTIFEDDSPVKYEIKEIGGIHQIISNVENMQKNIDDAKKHINKLEANSNKALRDIDKDLADKNKESDTTKNATKYKVISIKQSILTTQLNVYIDVCKIIYSQSKAAMVKAITANPKKLESAIYCDALAEAAAEEVEAVIDGAIDSEDISDSCNADKSIKDCGVSDDPGELTYDEDYYTSDGSSVKTSGTVDSDINSKSESAYFGKLFY